MIRDETARTLSALVGFVGYYVLAAKLHDLKFIERTVTVVAQLVAILALATRPALAHSAGFSGIVNVLEFQYMAVVAWELHMEHLPRHVGWRISSAGLVAAVVVGALTTAFEWHAAVAAVLALGTVGITWEMGRSPLGWADYMRRPPIATAVGLVIATTVVLLGVVPFVATSDGMLLFSFLRCALNVALVWVLNHEDIAASLRASQASSEVSMGRRTPREADDPRVVHFSDVDQFIEDPEPPPVPL